MKIDDKNFLLELKNKNPKALEFIINTYCNLVFKIVLNVLGADNYENVKECVNDIYLLIWNKNHLYNPEKSSFKNWLLAVSKYKAIDYKRSLSKVDSLQIEEPVLISKDWCWKWIYFKREKRRINKAFTTWAWTG